MTNSKPSPRCLLLPLLIACFAFACSNSSNDAGTDAGISPATDANESTESCNFQNCSGCCDGNTCVADVNESQCGQPGAACTACNTGDICAAGSCVANNDCSDCEGCCFEGTVCLQGNTKAACGSDGNSCVGCPEGQGCEAGLCETINCTPQNCDGCCTANGECIADEQQSTMACGKDADACSVCPGGTLSCTLGTCVQDQPCLDFCDDGCCTATGQCIPFADQSPGICGAAATCSECQGELSCLEGMCTADPVWTIVVKTAIISATNFEGEEWDQTLFTNALPDPYVMGALADDTLLDWATSTIDNTLTPNWNESKGSYLQSELIAQGLIINVRDSDGLGVFESIGSCIMSISQADLTTGSKVQATCGNVTDLEIGFVQQ